MQRIEVESTASVQGAKVQPFYMTVLLTEQTLRKSNISTHKTTKNHQESSPDWITVKQ